MTKLPQVKPKNLARAIQKAGFEVKRKTGSHVYFHHPRCTTTSISIHPQTMPKGTLRAVLRQTEISTEVLKELLK